MIIERDYHEYSLMGEVALKNKIMKSGIACLLVSSTIFISNIDTVVEAEESEAEMSVEESVTNEAAQPESLEESTEEVEVETTEERTTEQSAESTTQSPVERETVKEDVLVGAMPDDSPENEIRQRTITAHEANEESQESTPYAEPSSEQPSQLPSNETSGNDIVPEPTAEPVTEEAPTTETETETPVPEGTGQLPADEIPVEENEIPTMEPVEPSAEAPSTGSGTEEFSSPYPEVDNNSLQSESTEVPAQGVKRYFRYDHGNILEGITLEPGGPEADFELLDKRVNRLLSARIMEESEVDDTVIYDIEAQVKSEEEVATGTSREVLPNTGETNYTFIYGTVLLICGLTLLFIMRKPKSDK
ncbi:LPXTG cell wall anchor domain-containing protein [Salinicoccus sesuvii]|uniref:LPXTG cell wall anchor domain-containing protein n=2 Tax=Salinicoccus sesuvii TaxID=868281 RepID=A0ABV7N4F0_9STAP